MNLSNKTGIASVIVAIIGIVVSLFISNDSNDKASHTTNQSTTGNNSPAIYNTDGNVNITNNSK